MNPQEYYEDQYLEFIMEVNANDYQLMTDQELDYLYVSIWK